MIICSNSTPVGCFARVKGGLDLKLIVDGTFEEIPLSNIPNSVTVHELKNLLKFAGIKLQEVSIH